MRGRSRGGSARPAMSLGAAHWEIQGVFRSYERHRQFNNRIINPAPDFSEHVVAIHSIRPIDNNHALSIQFAIFE